MSSTGNPWDDYAAAKPSTSDGPWSDYAPKSAAPVASAPVEKPTSQMLGLYQGLTKPLDNAAIGAKWLANNALPFVPHRILDDKGNVVAQGAGDMLDTAAKMLGFTSTDDAVAAHKNYIANSPNKPGEVGKFVGEMAGTAPVAALGPIGGGAAAGALLTDATDPAHVAEDAGIGAVAGKVGDAIAGKVGRSLIAPIKQSPFVQKLLSEGVSLTPGQIIGGTAKRIEDAATSIPFVGDMIKSAQNRGTETFNKAALNRALKPIGQALPADMPVGRQAVDHVYSKISDEYDNLLPKMTGVADQQLSTDFNQIGQTAIGEGVKQDVLDRFNNVLKSQVKDRVVPLQTGPGIVPAGQSPPMGFTGQALKDAQGNLGNIGRKLATSQDADDRQVGSMVLDAQQAFNEMLERNNPGFGDQLKKVNTAFAQYARIRKAASAVGANNGVFTAPQFSSAVKALDKSAGKGAYARGTAMMQDLSDAGRNVLPSSVNDSGTATRAGVGALLGGAGLYLNPKTLALPGLAAAAYTQPGQRVITAALTAQRPQAVQNLGQLLINSRTPAALGAAAGATSLADLVGSGSYPGP